MNRLLRNSARRLRAATPADNVRELPSGTQLDDASLVSRACEGDRWAEEALYHRHVSYIMGMVTRCLGNRDEAEDVVQDTFAIGLDRLASVRQPHAIRGWFAQIAIRQVRRRLRRAKLVAAIGLGPSLEPMVLEELASRGSDAETRADLAAVGRILATFPTNDRIAWMLRYVEGEPLDEVARICGCSLATAKRRIGAAAAQLQLHLGMVTEAP
jgi:RNA polymerase sigma-70 factor (ECF subfamily)